MERFCFRLVALSLPLVSVIAHAQLCSTEKVNRDNCTVYISRRYPVTLPTIQMRPGKKVTVVVHEPLPFETLTLDWTTGTALPATDQGATLLTAVIPDLKGLYFSSVLPPAQPGGIGPLADLSYLHGNSDACDRTSGEFDQSECDAQTKKSHDALQSDLAQLQLTLETAQDNFKTSFLYLHLPEQAADIYAQLNQALSPIPKPGFDPDHSKPEYGYQPPFPQAPPIDPWTDYPRWREMMLCELGGESKDGDAARYCHLETPFQDLLNDISMLQGKLPAATPTVVSVTSSGTPPPPKQPDPDPNQLFDQKYFDFFMTKARGDLKLAYPGDLQDQLNATEEGHRLRAFQDAEMELTAKIGVISTTLTNVQKDFQTYYESILLANYSAPDNTTIGEIYDPADFQKENRPVSTHRLLGRQVTYSVNAVNQISTPRTSITATAAKISIATVTVLYADPIFETSAGGMVSFVHNRTFANQTVVTPQPGSQQVAGDFIISQTKTDPEVMPFVAGHWRITPDFTMPDQRRGAIYATVWGGLNAYTSLPEYGAGPTLSWRSFMFSAVYNRAHVVGLTNGQTIGVPICGTTVSGTPTLPSCTPAPAAPITQTSAINGFAIGISVRLPTTFTAGTGGVSH